MLVQQARIFAFLIFGLSGGAGAGQEGSDMKLEDVGFVMRLANTPAQIERLKLLPPRTFVARSKSGRRYFLYADPDYCKCVLVGDELAMKTTGIRCRRRRRRRWRSARANRPSPAR
jgi:hypothetical protein